MKHSSPHKSVNLNGHLSVGILLSICFCPDLQCVFHTGLTKTAHSIPLPFFFALFTLFPSVFYPPASLLSSFISSCFSPPLSSASPNFVRQLLDFSLCVGVYSYVYSCLCVLEHTRTCVPCMLRPEVKFRFSLRSKPPFI